MRPAVERAIVLASAVVAINCGGSPTTIAGDPILTCAADVAVTAHNGQQPTVSFDVPVAIQGTPPVRVVCTPASGTQFPNGLTTVTCEAIDARSHKSGCSFLVIVTPVPQLQKTTLLAFGDSITEGKIALRAQGGVVVPPGTFDTSVSYVEQLYPKLANRYQDQTVTLIAYGSGGEGAAAGYDRLRANWSSFNPDALLLLEGTNDLTSGVGSSAAVDGLVNALRLDVEFAKSKGVRVFLGTLVPITPPQNPAVIASVPAANTRIRSLAAVENVTLVDLNAALPDIYIGSQGLHPTAQGYEIMANEWFKAIVDTMEVKSATATLAKRRTTPPQTLWPVRGSR